MLEMFENENWVTSGLRESKVALKSNTYDVHVSLKCSTIQGRSTVDCIYYLYIASVFRVWLFCSPRIILLIEEILGIT